MMTELPLDLVATLTLGWLQSPPMSDHHVQSALLPFLLPAGSYPASMSWSTTRGELCHLLLDAEHCLARRPVPVLLGAEALAASLKCQE